jgi:DNA protecting protein DprA
MINTIAYLQLMLARGMGSRGIARLLDRLRQEERAIEDFVDASLEEIAVEYSLGEDTAASIRDALPEAEATAEELENHGVGMLARGNDGYPQKLEFTLAKYAPQILFVAGNLDILNRCSVGICGARKATDRGCIAAKICAEVLSSEGMNIVSGYASGVDSSAHYGALSSGGVTTMVLATGILQFTIKPGLSELIREENILVLSEFPPRLGWQVHHAMQRNRTICGISDSVILVEPGLSGGTFAAGTEAQRLQIPLFVVNYEDNPGIAMGNMHFIERGATPLNADRIARDELEPVIASPPRDQSMKQQASLFDDLDKNDT